MAHAQRFAGCLGNAFGREAVKPLVWENIDDYHKRAKVVGGWLVKAYEDIYEDLGYGEGRQRGYNWDVSMTFVPDEGHYWGSQDGQT
jgi:hypothetical protein